MSAGGIVPESGSTIVPAAANNIQQIQAGDMVSARVVGDLGEGKYNLQFKGRPGLVEVKSEVPLTRGRDLTLQVQQNQGKVVLKLVTAGAGGQVSANASDQATVPSPVAIAMSVDQAAAHATPGQAELPVGLVFSESSVAVHFPDGAVVEGRAQVPLPWQALAGANAEASAAANIAGTVAGDASGVAALMTDTLSEAALLADQVSIAVLLPPGSGQTAMAAVLTLPVQSLGALAANLGEAGQANLAGVAAEAVVVAVDKEQAEVHVRIGDIPARLLLPAEMNLAAGQALQIKFGSEIQLTGMLRITADGIHPFANLVDTSLQAAGLMPTGFSREAAQALLAEGVPVSRENVQALMALAGNQQEGERSAMLVAGARLIARDLPVTPPLAAGMAGIIGADADNSATAVLAKVQALVQEADALVPTDMSPVASQSLATAQASLRSVAVLLGQADTPQQIANFFNTLAREPMGQAAASLENAAGQIIARQPTLQRIDSVISALLTMVNANEPAVTEAGATEVQAAGARVSGQSAGSILSATATKLSSELATLLSVAGMSTQPLAHPGVNPTYMALVPPADAGNAQLARATEIVARILAAPSNEAAEQIVRTFASDQDRSLANAVLGRLQVAEQELIEQVPALRHVRDAVTGLRDLGRRFMVYKAENLAGMRQDPNVLVAEVPFRMDEQGGDGRLQVFYRRAGRKGPGRRWSARVVLDLRTTRMGPVVGDMRFFGCEVALNLFAADRETSDYIGSERGELTAALREKGFKLTPRFLVIPEAKDPLPRKSVFAARPVAGSEDWKLDVEA